jgi:hypothetical protein
LIDLPRDTSTNLEAVMVCDLTYCPTDYIIVLVGGILVAAFVAWFFLATQFAASLFGAITAIWRFKGPRRLSRYGRVLWTILVEGVVFNQLIVPALGYLIPLPPGLGLANLPSNVSLACFIISFFAGLMLVVDNDRSLET